MEAILALEDGRVFRGRGYGAPGERFGEVVFNTSLSGYQEILTDPSYAGQIVILTYPAHRQLRYEFAGLRSGAPYAEGLVVRELSELASNWRSEEDVSGFLANAGVPIISDIDTRALVRHLRTHGAMRGVISTLDLHEESLVAKAKASPSMVGLDLASRVTTANRYEWTEPSADIFTPAPKTDPPARFHVVAYDYGIKQNILRQLVDRGCRVTVVPATTPPAKCSRSSPTACSSPTAQATLSRSSTPRGRSANSWAACPSSAFVWDTKSSGWRSGGKTFKLKFGHHGGNHPVLNLETQKVEITAQNHGFAVDPDSLNASEVALTHMNLNDQTLEGCGTRSLPLFSVQYHPEASPGPHDSGYLFERFVKMMEEFERTN